MLAGAMGCFTHWGCLRIRRYLQEAEAQATNRSWSRNQTANRPGNGWSTGPWARKGHQYSVISSIGGSLGQAGSDSSWAGALLVVWRAALTVSNNSSIEKGFGSRAASWRDGFWDSASVGSFPVARMTGNAMRAERNFLTSSTPVSLGMLWSVIRR